MGRATAVEGSSEEVELEPTSVPDDEIGPDEPGGAQRRRILVSVLVVVSLLALGVLLGGVLRPGSPKDNSLEAGFARDMRAHHAQAVSMAMVEYQRSTNPELRAVAYDIALSQQREIGILDGWLTSWGLPLNSTAPVMSWMQDHGSHAASQAAGMMPGMATPGELLDLNRATGTDLDRLFLTLMIRHHEGGREMAAVAANRADKALIRNFASRVVRNQTVEIEQMQSYVSALPPPRPAA